MVDQRNNRLELDRHHIDVYDRIAVEFAATRDVHPAVTAYLDRLTTDLGPQALILDAGCGSAGQYTEYLSRSARAIGIDFSSRSIDEARKSHPALDFRVMNMRALDCTNGELNGIAAVASLVHFEKAEVPGVLAEFRRVLDPKGRMFVNIKGLRADRPVEGMETDERGGHQIVRNFSRYTPEEFAQMLTTNGFNVLDQSETQSGEHWLYYYTEVANG